MLPWLHEYGGTLLVSVLLLSVLAAIAAKLLRDRKRGQSSCGCGCGNCPMAGACHPGKKNEP